MATAIKAKQITPQYALDVWQRVAGILVKNESDPSPAKVIDLVAQYGITAYDGQFIALAMEMGILCVTEDGELQGKFPRVAVSIEDFLKTPTISGVRLSAPLLEAVPLAPAPGDRDDHLWEEEFGRRD